MHSILTHALPQELAPKPPQVSAGAGVVAGVVCPPPAFIRRGLGCSGWFTWLIAACLVMAGKPVAFETSVVAATFLQPGLITINDNSPASPYPSTLLVSGVTGVVSKLTVTLTGLSHTYPADVDALLVGPDGQMVMLMSTAGGGGHLTNVVLTFDDTAAQVIPSGNSNAMNGTFRAADYGSSPLPVPAPGPSSGRPYNTALAVFNGVDPNGTWQLFVNDHAGGDSGFLGSWQLDVTANTSDGNSAAAYTFTTFAGKAGGGSADGVGDAAQFNNPTGIAVDSAGNLYVTDTYNHTIRKITAAGVVSTLAGVIGSSGTADGTGSNARFTSPYGIAVDSAGNLYVADSDNSTIRKITAAGVVSTLAGLAGSSGSDDGTGSDARFTEASGIAVDSAGNLYVADSGNSTIRKITPVGTNWVVSTLAGLAPVGTNWVMSTLTDLAGSSGSADGTGSNARFNNPLGIAVDSAGNLYVADTRNHTIRKISPVGTNWVVSTLAGLAGSYDSADGAGSNARFFSPEAIVVDSVGNVFVADTINNAIRKITAAGLVSTFAGTAGFFARGSADGTGSTARFYYPSGIAMDNAGNLYVADRQNNAIRNITSAGVVSTLAGLAGGSGSADGTGSNAGFVSPSGIAVDSTDNIYVADTGNRTIRKITSAGVVSTLAGLSGSSGSADGTGSNARFVYPSGIAVDSTVNIYVADTGDSTIRKITSAGVVSTLAGLSGSSGSVDGIGSDARFTEPSDIAVDSAGNLYVTDRGNNTVRKITAAGVVSTVAGLAGSSGAADGTGSDARFTEPSGIAVDSAGNLYVADGTNNTIRKITSAGVVSTLAGLGGIHFGSADGTGSNARFYYPHGIAVDTMGNLYVADSLNSTIRKITSAGVVSTLAGLGGALGGSGDGTGSKARFNFPLGIALSRNGSLFVTDRGNSTIRKGVFTQYSPSVPVAYPRPPLNGQLTVRLVPPEANGQWRFPWEFGWRNSGATANNLVAGDYPVEFRNVPGWLALPLSGPVTVSSGATVITNTYYPTLSAGDTNSTPGSLTVSLGVAPPAGAGWRFLGEATPFLATGFTTNLPPGTYLIEFAPVSGRIKPPSQAVQVNAGQPAFLSVNYPLAATPPPNAYLPFPVPGDQVTDETTYPFGFNGQLQSDTGYGSGVAVQPNVVLTAAHLVFNDQTLSFVSRAHWFFQREAGVFEPQPQVARGYYVLSGYAAQRTNDLQSGYSPDQSTPPSRNLDVAALYFLSPAAGGGHGGYLPSDAVPNTWLTSTALKLLVGYPVDGSQFGATVVPGKLYQTDPQPYPLSLAPDPVPGLQQVYTAPWLLSYPGNSGGPLYVQLNGYYYPAAVYLGTLFSGSTPYASIVRAIDSNVVNLITLAQTQGDNGTNNTGGGVITIIPSQAISSANAGYVQWQLGPPQAVLAGAAWRLQGDASYSRAANYTRRVTTTNAFAVEFKPVPGWHLPTNQTVTVVPGQLIPSIGFYIVTNPVMVAGLGSGLGITGTTGTLYRIESRSSLSSGNWMPLSTHLINSNGLNLVLPRPGGPATFFRAVWLP